MKSRFGDGSLGITLGGGGRGHFSEDEPHSRVTSAGIRNRRLQAVGANNGIRQDRIDQIKALQAIKQQAMLKAMSATMKGAFKQTAAGTRANSGTGNLRFNPNQRLDTSQIVDRRHLGGDVRQSQGQLAGDIAGLRYATNWNGTPRVNNQPQLDAQYWQILKNRSSTSERR